LMIYVRNIAFLGIALKTRVQEVMLFSSFLHTVSRGLRPMTLSAYP
jgi:hypothetical protein